MMESRSALLTQDAAAPAEPLASGVIRATVCPVCDGRNVTVRFPGCRDLLYSTPGEFSLMACSSCNALFCKPQITPEQFDTYYPASYYPTAEQILSRRISRRASNRITLWALGRFWAPSARDTFLRSMARRSLSLFSRELRTAPPVRGGGRLLEVGCASGQRLYLLRQYGWDAEGIEPSADACAEARRLGIRVQPCLLEDADLPAKRFDVIELRHVFEHLADPPGCLAALRDALAPGGKIVLTLPNGRGLGLWLFGRYWRGLEVPRHHVVYTPETLRRLCSRLGLSVRRARSLVAPEVIVGSVKFALGARGTTRHLERNPADDRRCGSRYQPEKKLRNLGGRLLRRLLAVALLPAALLGRGEVIQVEILHGESGR
jgi:SAM-dependent methyltransferase